MTRGEGPTPLPHPGLAWLDASPEGRAWLARLPSLVEACVERWGLVAGEPYVYAYASLALRVRTPDGKPAVLKIQFPDRESEHEADALRAWDGHGAVRLLADDRKRRALLLERCQPGTPLAEIGAERALDVAIALLPRLFIPAGKPFRPLADEAEEWATDLPSDWERAGRPFERELIDAAVEALRSLATSQREQVLVHQDLHAGNVLRAEREPWLVIDPKPLVGEREFGVSALIRGAELGATPEHVLHRLDRLTAELGLDRDRAARWCGGQTLAWAFDQYEADAYHVEVARSLLLEP